MAWVFALLESYRVGQCESLEPWERVTRFPRFSFFKATVLGSRRNDKRRAMIKDIKAQNETAQPNDRIMAKLHADFPQCFNKEGQFDIERFQHLVQTEVDVTREGYELNFLGKNYANLIASTETETVIQPDLEHNAKPENCNSQNVYISGDNLDALKHLLKSYSNSIKCIYIDPPYNTGTDGFVYNDKFTFTKEQIQIKLGVSEEKAERILDLARRGSASHSAWLMFMAPRLMLAKDLLTEDGVIFISIDDNEQANLKLLCDSIYGEENFVAQCIINGTPKNDPHVASTAHEYCLVYVKNLDVIKDANYGVMNPRYKDLVDIYRKGDGDFEAIEMELKNYFSKNELEDDNISNYKYADEYGVYRIGPLDDPQSSGPKDNRINPLTGNYCAIPSRGWSCTIDTWNDWVEQHLIKFPDDDSTLPSKKTYVTVDRLDVMRTIFKMQTRKDTDFLKKLFEMPYAPFSNPKPVALLKTFIENCNDKNMIVCDFFSGSATTMQAVMELNIKDKGKRKCILVQLQEPIIVSSGKSNKAKKIAQAAIEYLDRVQLPYTIDNIGQERIRLYARQINIKHPDYQGDLGFKHYTLKDVPQNTLDKIETFDPTGMFGEGDILQSFGKDTVLESWCVKDGYGFGAKVSGLKLAKYTAYHCGSHLYFVEGNDFDENAMIALIDKYHSDTAFNPQNIVLFGYSFSFTQVEMLRKNLATLSDSAKNLNINLDIRY